MLQDITNISLDTGENSQTNLPDDSRELKCKIQEALGAISKLPSDEVLQHIRRV